MTYRVTAPLVLAVDKEGRVHHRYHGAVIDWLSADQKEHFLDSGLVEDLGSAEERSHPRPTASRMRARRRRPS